MIYGLFGMFIQFLIYPPVARRLGILNCFKTAAVIFPIVYLVTPFTVLLPTSTGRQIALVATMLVKSTGAIFAFPSSTILITNSAASLLILGTLNGVATSMGALGRAAGSALGGSTFSAGVKAGYVILPWWTLALTAAVGALPVWWLVEMEGFGQKESEEVEDDEAEGDDQRNDDLADDYGSPPVSVISSSNLHLGSRQQRLSSPLGSSVDYTPRPRRLSRNLSRQTTDSEYLGTLRPDRL